MSKVNSKVNTRLSWTCIILTLLLMLSSIFLVNFYASAGNNAGSDGLAVFDVILDVNGKTFSDAPDGSKAVVESNNSKGYSLRKVGFDAVMAAYKQGYSAATMGYNNFERPVIVSSLDQHVLITVDASTGAPIYVFSIPDKTHAKLIDNAKFSIKMTKNATGLANSALTQWNDSNSFYINIGTSVVATFLQAEGTDSTNQLAIGKEINADGNISTLSSEVLSLTNFTKTENLSFEKWLKKRELSSVTVSGNDVIADSDGAWTVQPLLENQTDSSSKPWDVENVNQISIETVDSGDYLKRAVTFQNSPGGKSASTFIIDPNITNEDIGTYESTHGGAKFWESMHSLRFKVKTSEGKSGYINIRVKLTPSDAPKRKSSFKFPTQLNVTSDETYFPPDELGSGEAAKVDCKMVKIRPFDLVDYPGTSDINFIPSKPPTYSNSKKENDNTESNLFRAGLYVDVDGTRTPVTQANVGEFNMKDFYYILSGLADGNDVITFTVLYKGNKEMIVPVTFDNYGDFKIVFTQEVKGKRAVNFSFRNAMFSEIRSAGFTITNAYSSNPEVAFVKYNTSNNSFDVEPKAQGSVDVFFEFSDLNGRKVNVFTNLVINYNGKSIGANFETWELALIIGGSCIGGIALILFIVWLFIRGISRKKQDVLATSAPTSSYIIKLNSTIAAAQAQQRLATTQAFSNAQASMLQLGAGPATMGANPSTLQLGTAGPISGSAPGEAMSMPGFGDVVIPASPPPSPEEIFIPVSDDELLERIFVEKFEPRGMVRRTFFKSKELQSRELEKEKTRIREAVRKGIPIEEACKSDRQKSSEESSAATETKAAAGDVQDILGFDPNEKIEVEIIADEKEDRQEEGITEDQRVVSLEKKLESLKENSKTIDKRIEKTEKEYTTIKAAVEASNNKLAVAEDDNKKLKDDIDDLEFKMATAKPKEKEKLAKDIKFKEDKMKYNKDNIDKYASEVDAKYTTIGEIENVLNKLKEAKTACEEEIAQCGSDLEQARIDLKNAQERLNKIKLEKERRAKLENLNPLLLKVNTVDIEIRQLINSIENNTKEKDMLKTEASSIQTQLLATTEVDAISALSARMGEINKRITDLERQITADNKSKSDKNINYTAEKRKANDFVDRQHINIDDVVSEEDKILGELALDDMKQQTESDRVLAEEALSRCQAAYDELVENNNFVLETAVQIANDIKIDEAEYEKAKFELDDLTIRMEEADDDEKLMLSIDQMSLSEKVNELASALDKKRADGIKSNLEAKMKYEADIELAKANLENAQKDYETANIKINETINSINPLDLILSGSGVISQDRKKLEAENLKKLLEQSKDAIEQAKLQAQMAQMEAQKAIIDAQRASDASKAEAEKMAQEAIAKAEEAKLVAEKKAEEVAIRVKQEAEEAKRLAEEEAERLKKQAEEESERLRQEAEEAKRKAEEVAERAKQEAEEVKRRAELEAEESKRFAEEEAEKAKRQAEEEAERIRRQVEDEAARAAKIEADKQGRINEKINNKKNLIMILRNDLKGIKSEQDGKDLKEKFYSVLVNLDDDEKSSSELSDLLTKSMDDASHAAELSIYKDMAKNPRTIMKKRMEIVNKVRKPEQGARPGARPAGARPAGARPGARPAGSGARPTGARPAGSGARPAGARPAGSGARPGARPAGSGARPGARPTGARPGTRPPSGTRPRRPQ